MKKLDIMHKDKPLTARSDSVPRGLEKRLPIARMMPLLAAALMLTMAGASSGQVMGSLNAAGSLSGLDPNGNAASYFFAIGYGDAQGNPTWLAQSDLSASSLTGLTLPSLLTATYNNLQSQLSPTLQSDLTLDLANNAINFAFPGTGQDACIEAACSDTVLAPDLFGASLTSLPAFTTSTWTLGVAPPIPGWLQPFFPPQVWVKTPGGGTYSCPLQANYTVSDLSSIVSQGGLQNGGNSITFPTTTTGNTVFFTTSGLYSVGGYGVVVDDVPEPASSWLLLFGGSVVLSRVVRRK